MTGYRVSVDLDACDGVFACLVRDGRFAEAEDGLVTLPGGDREGGELVAAFEDGRREDAEQAAAACPLDAIEVESEGERSEPPEPRTAPDGSRERSEPSEEASSTELRSANGGGGKP